MFQEQLQKAIITGKIVPKYYVFAPVHGLVINTVNVQEYLHKPTMLELEKFLTYKLYRKVTIEPLQPINKEERLLCKQFVNQHLGKNLKKEELEEVYDNLESAYREIYGHSESLLKYEKYGCLIKANVAVIGFTKNGKVRLAIVDL